MSYGREFLEDHVYEIEHGLPIKELTIPSNDAYKKGEKRMGILVYILGRSGTGKSFSMRNFPKDKIAVINVQGKVLPFKGAKSIEQTATDNSSNILKALDIYAHDYKSIVVDDYQYVMSNEFMRRSYEKGYDKFTEIGRHAWDIANKVRDLPEDVIVYIMCHTDRDDEGNEKIKTIGKLLDEKVCLEGLSTIVLKTNVADGQYTFLTQNNGKDTVKSPFGMFPTYAIDNDLWYVDNKIRNYYEIGEYKNDEEVAQMDQEVAKPEIEKPDASGRRSRRKKDTEDAKKVEPEGLGTADGQGNVSASAPSVETASSEPKPRRRKARNEQAEEVVKEEEKPLETAVNEPEKVEKAQADFKELTKDITIDPNTGEVLTPKRTRRRRANTITKDEIDNFTVSISDDDLPF